MLADGGLADMQRLPGRTGIAPILRNGVEHLQTVRVHRFIPSSEVMIEIINCYCTLYALLPIFLDGDPYAESGQRWSARRREESQAMQPTTETPTHDTPPNSVVVEFNATGSQWTWPSTSPAEMRRVGAPPHAHGTPCLSLGVVGDCSGLSDPGSPQPEWARPHGYSAN